jgi:hypothetical protein
MPAAAAYTSVRQVPAAYKDPSLAHLFQGKTILDWGAGRFPDAQTWLKENLQCTSLPYDPFNLPVVLNLTTIQAVMEGQIKVDTIACLNVLNVLQDKEERAALYLAIALAAGAQSIPAMVIQVYEGNGSGIPSTGKVTQTNLKMENYLEEIQEYFPLRTWDYTKRKNTLVMTRKQ